MDLYPAGKRYLTNLFILCTFCTYVAFALYANAFGPNAPVMMAFYGITSGKHGFLVTMQALGCLITSLYLSIRGERHNKIKVIAFGVIVLSLAGLAAGFAPSYNILALVVMMGGVGCSSLDVMVNGMIPEVFPDRKNTLLPIAHAFFGIGAMLSPLLVTALTTINTPSSFTKPFLVIGVFGILVFAALLFSGASILPYTPYNKAAFSKKSVPVKMGSVFLQPKAWVYFAAAFTYFAFQVGIVSWLPSFCVEKGFKDPVPGLVMTLFLLGSLVMRFCGPLILKKISAKKAYFSFNVFSAVLFTLAICFAHDMTCLMALTALSGFMQGSSVAFLVLMATESFPGQAASASSVIFIAANSSCLTVPLLMGVIAERTGYFWSLLLVCVLMMISALVIGLPFIEKAKV